MSHERGLLSLLFGGSKLLGGQIALVAIGFGQTWLATRALGPPGFGAWALLLSISTLAGLFLSFRTSEAFTSFWVEAKLKDDAACEAQVLSAALYAEVATKVVAALVVVTAAPFVLLAAGAPAGLAPAVACVALVRLLSVLDPIWFTVLRHQRAITELSAQPVVIGALQLALTLGLIAGGQASLFGFAVAQLIAQAASALWKLIAVNHRLARPLIGPGGAVSSPQAAIRDYAHQRPFWAMMSAGYLSSCLSSLVKEGDGLLVGLLGGAREVGFYRLAKSLAGLLQTAAQSLSTLLFQQFAELHAGRDLAAMRRFVARVAPPLAMLALAGGVVLWFAIAPLLLWVFGARYLPTLLPFRILLVGIAVSSALVWVSPLLTMLRKMKDVVALNLFTFVVFAATLLVAGPRLHALAPALALSLAWSLGHLAGAWRAGVQLDPRARPA